MRYNFNLSDTSISIFFNGRMHSVPASNSNFKKLYDHLKLSDHDANVIESLVDVPKRIARLTEGLVSVVGSTVYFKGNPVHTTLTVKLVKLLDAGFDVTPWARFMERVMENPSDRSRECLFDFLDHFNAPLTEDGHFLAFKRVTADYKDIYTKTMDNSPGQVVEMDRSAVNPDPNKTCSYGLHVAATSYLDHYASAVDNKTIVCKVDPVDVVAVPTDYNGAKMRVCRYVVLGDAEEGLFKNAEDTHVAYTGTEAATGEVTDLSGKPICYNAVDFSENWKRELGGKIEIGTLVAPAVTAMNDELPSNKFMVGEVVDVREMNPDDLEYEDDIFWINSVHSPDDFDEPFLAVAVEWQDGSVTEDLVVSPDQPRDSEVVAVDFIGEKDDVLVLTNRVDEGDGALMVANRIYDGDGFDYDDDLSDDDEDYCTYCGAEGTTDEDCEDCAETDEEEQDEQATELSFTRNGVTYTASEVTEGLKKHGQRGYSRLTGIPRTTLQDWIVKIEACA